MRQSFRESMRWLHTWSGLIFGWLLFAVFVTGTSSYYKDEINLWMKPEFHNSKVSPNTMHIAVEKAINSLKKADNVSVTLPDSRSNIIAIRAQNTSNNTAHNTAKSNTSGQRSEKKINQVRGGEQRTGHGQRSEKGVSQDRNAEQRGKAHGQRGEKTATQAVGSTKQNNNQQQRKKRRTPSTYYDATTGELIKETTKTAGGNFLYRFHFELYSIPRDIARWIVGIATMLMLVAIISGIIIHKRIFKDIFTFRARNNPRGWMDAHILPAVAALPFLIMITYSGLLLFTNTMFPYGMKAIYGDDFMEYRKDMIAMYNQNDTKQKVPLQQDANSVVEAIGKEDKTLHRIATSNALRVIHRSTNNTVAHRIATSQALRDIGTTEAPKVPFNSDISKETLIEILEKAQKIWPENIGGFTIVKDKNNLIVEITPKDPSTLFSGKLSRESITFDARTRELIKEVSPPSTDSVVLNTSNAFRALHEAKFADSTLRVIFFLSGIMGTILAATGLILWIEKRKKKNLEKKSFGFWLVEKLNLGTIMGIFIAIAIFFIANRMIVVDESVRRVTEINIFFIAWLVSYLHAFVRDTFKAWKEQLLVASILFILVPIVNAVTVFESITQAFSRDNIFIYFDIFSIFMAFVFLFIRYILIKKEKRKGVEQ